MIDLSVLLFPAIEILVATMEKTQSLDSDVIQDALSRTSFSTFYANMTFDDNRQGSMELLILQV